MGSHFLYSLPSTTPCQFFKIRDDKHIPADYAAVRSILRKRKDVLIVERARFELAEVLPSGIFKATALIQDVRPLHIIFLRHSYHMYTYFMSYPPLKRMMWTILFLAGFKHLCEFVSYIGQSYLQRFGNKRATYLSYPLSFEPLRGTPFRFRFVIPYC